MTKQKNDHFEDNLLNYLETILSRMPCYVYWKDKNFVYQGCNDLTAQLLNLQSRESIVGLTDYDFGWNEKDVNAYRKIDEEIIKTGKSISVEETISLPGGEKLMLLVNKEPIFNKANQVIGIVGISVDITDRKKLEHQLVEAIESKSTFLSVASHEIKGPLTNSISIIEMIDQALEKEDLTRLKKLKPLLDAQLKDSRRGVDIIDYLLDFLRLDVSKKQPREVIIRRRLLQILDNYEQKNPDIEFDQNYDDKVPKVIFLPCEIEKILKIFYSNAVKYSKSKDAVITTGITNSVKGSQNYITIFVEDNGIGINQAALERFFIPLLSEGKKDGERVFTAPAIKLSYAKRLVELMGGELEITSEQGIGTRVSITLPYETSPDQAIANLLPYQMTEYDEIEEEIPNRKLRFLVVEDNPLTLQLLQNELIELGHDVDVASNAYDALALAKENNHEVIFLDISLPGMDGVELKSKLAKSDQDLPLIIAVTSHDSQADVDYFIDKGFVAVMGKPFTKNKVIDCVNTAQKILLDSDD